MKVSEEQFDEMKHALGNSHKRSELGWRNYFCTEEGNELWLDLVDKGMAVKGSANRSDGYTYFHVSDEGITYVKSILS